MSTEELFWNASIDELSNGYVYEKQSDTYICLICNEHFENGVIFKRQNALLEAKKAILYHINDNHNSMFDYLLSMDKKYTGLSPHQKDLLQLFKLGLTDKEIVNETNSGSTSTIRNYRFKFKEKEKQAKIFLAIMNVLRLEKHDDKRELVSIHRGAKMVDERYAITIEEKEKVLQTYFENEVLTTFPSKEKRKIIVLQEIIKRFKTNKVYSENEINVVLKSIYNDFATIRRYLIEYGFMERSKDCTRYWIN